MTLHSHKENTMKKCPTIVDVTYDEESLKGIERIKELHDLTKIGRIALIIGHLYSIFGGSSLRNTSSTGALSVLKLPSDTIESSVKSAAKAISSEATQTGYAIYQANWEYFFESFDALDKIKAREIEKLALHQAFAHARSPKEYKFWRAIEQGCRP